MTRWTPSFPLRLAALLAWMGLIFLFSADSDSADTSGGVLETLLALATQILGPIDPATREIAHFGLRKAAHFTEYAILALLWTGVLPKGPRRLLLAFWLTTGYAVSDEIHQAFVPQRGPSPLDVLIDAGGAGTALAALKLIEIRLSGYRQAENPSAEQGDLDSVTKFH